MLWKAVTTVSKLTMHKEIETYNFKFYFSGVKLFFASQKQPACY